MRKSAKTVGENYLGRLWVVLRELMVGVVRCTISKKDADVLSVSGFCG